MSKRWAWPITRPTRQAPAEVWASIAADGDLQDPPVRFLYVGTPGDLVIEGADGVAATFRNAQGFIWASARRVLPDTTASDIVGCY